MINGYNFSVNSPTGYSHSKKKNIYIYGSTIIRPTDDLKCP